MPRFRSYHLHLPRFLLDSSKQMSLLYLIRILRDLVNKIALFFIPIFLYQAGVAQTTFLNDAQNWVSLSEFQWGMVFLVSYFILFRSVVLAVVFPIAHLIKHKGLGRVMLYGLLAYIVLFALLIGATQYIWFILLAAVVDGIQTALFWTPYHVILARSITRKEMGKGLGLVQFFVQLAAAVAPAIAGASIFLFGYSFVYLLSAGIILVTIVAAFYLENTQNKEQLSLEKMKKWLQRPQFRKQVVSFAGKYINDASIVVWPLYVFLLLGAIDRVGYIYSISLFISMILSLFIGSYIDHHKEKKLFFVSGSLLSVLWLARTAITSIWGVVFVDTAERLSSNFHWLFYDAKLILGGKGSQALTYFTFREMLLSFAAIIFWSLFLLIFLFFGSWKTLFIVAAIGVLLSLLVTDSVSNKVQ